MGKAIALSMDHKPSVEGERARIEAAGSCVRDGRVSTPGSFGGHLSVSRGLGDFEHKLPTLAPDKQAVTAEPEMVDIALSDGDEFVLLACDGIWDVMSSQEAVDFVRAQLKTGTALSECSAALLKKCFDLGSTDNMTALVFRPHRKPPQEVASAGLGSQDHPDQAQPRRQKLRRQVTVHVASHGDRGDDAMQQRGG